MPIVNDYEGFNQNTNGDINNSNHSSDDEDSFVVLERSTAEDPVGMNSQIQSFHTLQSFAGSCTFPVFNNPSGNGSVSTTTFNHNKDSTETYNLPFDTNIRSLSVDDIQKQLQELMHENIKLKEHLFQTNLAVKQHMNTVRLLQDKAKEVQENHQVKFEETKALIVKMSAEKNMLEEKNRLLSSELKIVFEQEMKDLKRANVELANELTLVSQENVALRNQVSCMQLIIETSKEQSKKPTAKEEELREVIDKQYTKLSSVERVCRKQAMDLERLEAQLNRANEQIDNQQKLSLSDKADVKIEQPQSLVQAQTETPSINSYNEKLTGYEEIVKQLKTAADEENSCFNSLGSLLTSDQAQFEVAELRKLLAQEQLQSITRKESLCQALTTIEDLLSDFQKLAKEFEMLKANHAFKESHSLKYEEMRLKSFNEKLGALAAEIAEKGEKLAISDRHLASLYEAVRLQNTESVDGEEMKKLKDQMQVLSSNLVEKDKKLQVNSEAIKSLTAEINRLNVANESVELLSQQVNIYKVDFEEERRAREAVVAEKNRIILDYKLLQRRNQELITQVQNSQNSLETPPESSEIPSESPRIQNVHNEACAEPKLTTKQNLESKITQLLDSHASLIECSRFISLSSRSEPPVPPPRPELICPNSDCGRKFSNYGELHTHVIQCWSIED